MHSPDVRHLGSLTRGCTIPRPTHICAPPFRYLAEFSRGYTPLVQYYNTVCDMYKLVPNNELCSLSAFRLGKSSVSTAKRMSACSAP